MKWIRGQPGVAGYYLAAWKRGSDPKLIVSELWFNETTGWFKTRGYLGDHSDGMRNKVSNVLFWMPLPDPPRSV